MSSKYIAYTDGACSNNQASGGQPGGWGVIFTDGRQFSGYDKSTTNNRMELKAAIEALKNIPENSSVDIHSDSAYLINAFQQNWITNWLKRNWITSQGKPVENQDLWKELIQLEKKRKVNWVKVKGHSGDELNEMADKLAVEAMINRQSKIIEGNAEKIEKTELIKLCLSSDEYQMLLNIVKDHRVENPQIENLYNVINNRCKN